LAETVRNRVRFLEGNLFAPALLHDEAPYDAVFCRNVLIYFDQDTKAGIFGRLAKMLEADGVMALGAAESVVGISDAFKPYPDLRGLYRLNTAASARAGGAAINPHGLKAVASAAAR